MATRPNNNEEERKSQDQNQPSKEQGERKSMPAYLEAALRLSSSRPLGAPRTDTLITGSTRPQAFDGTSILPGGAPVPGIMALDYVPTLGYSDAVTSALNRAAYQEFNVVRSAISGNRPYEPADHMIYRMCVAGLRDLYHYVRRVYGIVRKYSVTNLYRPVQMLRAMGLDAEDWINNAAALYQWLLNTKEALKPFPTVPLGTITGRHEAFNTFLFTDGEIESTQTYIMNQRAFYSYEKVDEVKGATIRSMATTYSAFLTMWDEMYAALMSSSDVYVIAADIRRAFTDRVITDLPDTSVDYTVEYAKLDTVLSSIMNAAIVPCSDVTVFKVTDQVGEGLRCTPRFSTSNNPRYGCGFAGHINSISADPSASDISNMVRLKPAFQCDFTDHMEQSKGQDITMTAFGTEVVVDARIVSFQSDGTTATNRLSTLFLSVAMDGDNAYLNIAYAEVALTLAGELSVFDWHPPVWILAVYATRGSALLAPLEDVQNYIPVSETQLKQIFEALILAEFGF